MRKMYVYGRCGDAYHRGVICITLIRSAAMGVVSLGRVEQERFTWAAPGAAVD